MNIVDRVLWKIKLFFTITPPHLLRRRKQIADRVKARAKSPEHQEKMKKYFEWKTKRQERKLNV